MKLFILFGVMALVVLIMIIMSFTYVHESAHDRIFNYFECKNTTVYYDVWKANTTCNDYSNVTDYKTMMALHATNEIVGYHMRIVTMSIFLTGFFGVFMFLAVVKSKEVACESSELRKTQSDKRTMGDGLHEKKHSQEA